MSSGDLTVFWRELIECYRDMMVAKTATTAAEYLDLTDAETERLRALAARFSMEQLIYHSRVLEDALGRMQRPGAARRATVELALTRLCEPRLATGEEALLARLAELESKVSLLRSGAVIASSFAAPPVEAPPAPVSSAASPAPAAPPAAPAAESTYRAFPGWREVVEEIGRGNPGMAALLSGSRAAISSAGQLVVSVASSFSLTILHREESRATLRAAAESVGEMKIAGIEIKSNTDSNGSNTILGELERALAECK